jgi:uracil-DNA glycosylase family 4
MPSQEPEAFQSLAELNSAVVSCELCPRLRRYSSLVAEKKRRQFMDWQYWGRPLPGYGDPRAHLMILGLAPAAHGGNRTGRMFTGDGSAQFLMAALHRFSFANQLTSESLCDGLKLRDAYMTAVVRCVPPRNKPRPKEIENCRRYWAQELKLLSNLRVVLTLGQIAFNAYVKHLKEEGLKTNDLPFQHAAFYTLPGQYPALCASYHPSRQNTQTGRLTVKMFDRVFRDIRSFLDTKPNEL